MITEALRITVESGFVTTRSGEKNGKPWSMSTQSCWAYFVDPSGVPDKFPSKIDITLEKDNKGYAIGEYVLSSASFYRGDFNAPMMRVRLAPCTRQKA